ncbi:MAG: GNAT family N-acetyltransferase, partial [Carnobacterium sp.]
MLINYKNDYEKIMMGLLSFVPDLKEVSRLKAEINWYQAEENRRLYLWSNEETTDFIGMLGIEIEPEMVLLRHISINPSFRKEGISFRMLQELDEKLP